jgi:hypothetical protein
MYKLAKNNLGMELSEIKQGLTMANVLPQLARAQCH